MGLGNTVIARLGRQSAALCLNCGELEELQRRRGAPLSAICRRLTSGAWRIDDVIDAVVLGLIGAGCPVCDASVAVAAVAADPFRASGLIEAALAAIAAAFVGVPDRGGEDRPGPDRPVDFARFRAKFMEFQISPAEVARLSLGELLSTLDAFGRKGEAPTEAEYDEIIAALAALNDPAVRVH